MSSEQDGGPSAVSISIQTTQTLDTMLHQVLNQALVAVRAKSGSLMLVAGKEGVLQIKARLGEPRPGRTTERVFRIEQHSVATHVVRTKRSYLCRDVESDPHFAPSRSGQNFLSLLSVPIVHDATVLAVINADADQKDYFDEDQRRLLEQVARQVARPIAERISIIDALAQVGVELTRLPREGGVERVLEKITELAVRSLGADVVTLYQYDQERDEFLVEGTGPTIGGDIGDRQPMRRAVHEGDVPRTVVNERKSGFYTDVQEHAFLTRELARPGAAPRPRFAAREGINSMAALLLPFRAAELPAEEVVGVMFANYRSPHSFNIDEISALATFADYAAVAILNARHEERRRTEEVKLVESIAANFAHRMNNLAGPGRVAAQLLRDRIGPDDTIGHRQLERIEHEADMLLELAERLVRRFKETGRTTELAWISIPELLDEELQRTELQAERVELIADIARDLPAVQSDEIQLRQVVRDLVANAIEAMADREVRTLTVRARLNGAASRVEIEIGDNGVGIAAELADRLFAPGMSTKKGKLGIGLWYSRTFLRAIRGDLVLKETAPGKGATFLIQVPTSSSPGAQRQEKDVLIVDDEPHWREQVQDTLADRGLSVGTAATYAEAYHAVATTQFRVAVVDICLVPGDESNKDGLRLLADLDKLSSRTRVVVIAGHPDEEDHHILSRHGHRVLRVVTKSRFDAAAFRDLIDRAVASVERQTPA